MSLVATGVTQPSVEARYDTPALVVGRALHAPWTEGTRVINRNFARVAALTRPVRVLSVTDRELHHLTDAADSPRVEHVFTTAGYGSMGMQLAVPKLIRHLNASGLGRARVAHLFGVPLSMAPWFRHHGSNVVVHIMAVSLRRRDRLLVRASMRLFKPWIDAFAVTSEALVPQLAAAGIDRARIRIVPPAIETDVFTPGDKLAARHALGVDSTESLVLYLGRLSPQRFPAEVVASALGSAQQASTRPIRFLALSPDRTFDGSENTAQYLLECSRVAERKLREVPGVRIDVRLGSLDEQTKITLLRAADAVLLPFVAPEAVEPPLTLLEAMACAATVIATPATNRSGLIHSGCNGFICQTPLDFSARLVDVLATAGQADRLGANARQSVIARHSFSAVADTACDLWNQVERGRPRSWPT